MDTGTAAGLRSDRLAIGLATAALLAVSAPAAPARPAGANTDGRPNILVVMTDDMASTDLKFMPNVRRLLARQGTKFAGAVDSFPLCCPARATFITGQYAHNHGVGGNFYPYGWYGMKDRGNTLPAWLQKAGYRTALIGKWLNGYGARDAHGEVPQRLRHLARTAGRLRLRLLQLRDEPRRQADDLGRRRVRSQAGQVRQHRGDPEPGRPGRACWRSGMRSSGRRPITYWGTHKPPELLARRHRPDHRAAGRRASAMRASPFFIWWAPAAPHREDVATTLMGRPGRDPRPRAALRAAEQAATSCRGPRASTSPTSPTSRRTSRTTRRP